MTLRNTFTKYIPQGLAWAGLICVFLIFQQYTEYVINDYSYEFSWSTVSIKYISFYLIWALFYPFLRLLGHRFSLANSGKIKSAGKLFLAGIIVALVHRGCAIVLFNLLFFFKSGHFGGLWQDGWAIQITIGWFSSFIEYVVIMAVISAIDYYQLYLQKQRDLDSARLNALKMQLQPHFLFNTLNSITSLIDIDKKSAQKMLSQLGYLLREILEHDDQVFIPLDQEIKYVATYLDIEHTRFQDRMKIEINVEEDVQRAKIPALLLQPLVENAVKHGISKCADGGAIKVNVLKKDDDIEITVANDFRKMNGAAKDKGYGIGLSNIRSRLSQIYGSRYSYEQSIEGSIFISKISIPFELYLND